MVEEETEGVINEFHKGICGHHTWRDNYKILRAGYNSTKLFFEVNAKVRSYREFQIFVSKEKIPSLPLVPIIFESPFQQWGLDFIGKIHPTSSAKHSVG
jgi:hypothetical protein